MKTARSPFALRHRPSLLHRHGRLASLLSAFTRRAARRLELRSFPLLQEQFSAEEGWRACLAIALPLAAAMVSGQHWLAWAVFAAFWTCLCDAPGPHVQRRRLLAGFAVAGTVVAFIGSWSASWSSHAALLAAPVMVLLSVTLIGAIQSAALLGTLLAVVAVVAAGFPHAPALAALQAASFLIGALWAWLLINLVWRIDEHTALRQAAQAALLRMLDMSRDLLAARDGQHREQHWHSEHGEHRRAVRLALERLRTMLQLHERAPGGGAHTYRRLLEACEMIFSALIALEHAAIQQLASPGERRIVARVARIVVLRAYQRLSLEPHAPLASNQARPIDLKRSSRLTDTLMRGCLSALMQAHTLLLSDPAWAQYHEEHGSDDPSPTATRPDWRTGLGRGLQQGARQAAGVAAVFYAAQVFQLGYPYWATMAVVVVLQGAARQTWTRCLERILGSLLGGALALSLLQVASGVTWVLPLVAVMLAGLAIALRLVNYTVFVVFLTMLFICVTEMLQPGVGIASARALDNLIGSAVALLAALALWPELGASPRERIALGLKANRDYLDAVVGHQPPSTLRRLQRQAGLASIDAETALHDLGGLRRHSERLSHSEMARLREVRELAGQASVAWHLDQGTRQDLATARES
ncbi:FUSC family protein [Herbaspirillum sp. AP02]|uniref:FUSC family protein n=1 Tax=unclassified Herbaspirillum TaxID=2624150 RepID=UPI0015DB6799|nr:MULTISPECIES: FUSC family protein [unclassified Herbaspirillum]MBG7622550.1 FUSC family protein [Herbaspirillum sp. AP02]NZD70480.1 FUSC family protein [Herbaspirillum sp. AP21]